MHVGFVGTGNMGAPMAENVVKAGHTLTVYDREPGKTAALERLGAGRAPDLPALARECRVSLLSLPDARAVEVVLFGTPGAPGLIEGAQGGDFALDLSTVGPESTRALAARAAERGLRLVDAPVSGGVSGARAGTLALMMGATVETIAPFEPVLRAIGKNLFYLDELGRGNALKLLNNYVSLTNQAVLCEAVGLADRLGIPRQTLGDVLLKSSGASDVLQRKLKALVGRDYRAGFFIDLAWKDLGLGLELGERVGATMQVGREAWKLYGRAREAGLGRLDSSGLLGLLEPREAG